MANWLVRLGCQVCCLDLLANKPTDVVDEAGKDVVVGLFDCVWVARPPKATEKEAKVIWDGINDILAAAWDNHKTWGLSPLIRQLLQLSRVTLVTCDGCRFGYSEQRPLQAARLGQRRPLHAQRDALQPRQRPCHCKHTPHLAQIYAYSLHRGYRTMTLEREDL